MSSDNAAMPPKLGEYEVQEKLGEGGMGAVYRGYQPSLAREVALKVLAPKFAQNETFVARFNREARAAASLVHPNVIQVFSIGCEAGVHYFAMEYVRGKDVAEHLKEGRRFSIDESVDIVLQVSQALAGAAEAGLVHRDIKPSNIMLAERGMVKMTDFGLAKTMDSNLTEVGTIVGTANYMSPEQGQGKPLDTRSDIYSLGVVFFELCTGRTPFIADSPAAVLYKHVYEEPPRPASLNPVLPAPIEAVILRMLAKDPEKRPASGEDLLRELRLAHGGTGALTGERSAAPAAAAPSASGPVPAVAATRVEPQSSGAMRMRTALVADDAAAARRLFSGILVEKGFRVLEAENGEEALDLALHRHPDLILLDLNLPKMPGLQVLQEINRQGADCRVIIVSGIKNRETVEQVRQFRINGYLTKPINIHELRARIDKVMDAPPPAAGGAANVDNPEHKAEDRRFILVCDRQPYSQILFRQILEAAGHKVACVNEPEEARAILEEDQPDLLILAIAGEDEAAGLSFLEEAGRRGWTMPILTVVGEQEQSVLETIRAKTRSPVMYKPVRLEELRVQVERALAESRQIPKAMMRSGLFASILNKQLVRDNEFTVFDFARSLLPVVPKAQQQAYLEKIQDETARAVCGLIGGVLKRLSGEQDAALAMRFIRYAYRHGNFETRNLCLALLGEILPVAEEIKVLSKIVTDEDFRIRIRVLHRLGELGAGDEAPLVVRFLNDDVWKVRIAAAESLEMMGTNEVIEPLVQYYARLDAALPDRLRKLVLGSKDAARIQLFERLARDGNHPATQAYAVRLLGDLGSLQAAPVLLELLKDKNGPVRAAAASALGRLRSDRALADLFAALADANAEVQAAVVDALLQHKLTPGAAFLVRLLGGRGRRIAPEAVQFAQRLNRGLGELEKTLGNLEREPVETRKYLSLLLSTVYPDVAQLKAVVRELNAKSPEERERAAQRVAEELKRRSAAPAVV